MNITIFGYGFVGKAHEMVLKDKHKVTVVDPAFNDNTIGKPDAVIVAVSTPEYLDGSCNMHNVYNVLQQCPKNIPILIKSTISLEGWRQIRERFPKLNITFSPEFLRAATALEDFAASKAFYFGGGDTDFWANMFWEAGRKMYKKEPEELIMMKYTVNSFLALKVSFFNQMFDLCQAAGINYDQVKKLVAHDARIGESHMDITEQRGFGGHCFPKDTSALLETSKLYNANLSILQEAVSYNKAIRTDG